MKNRCNWTLIFVTSYSICVICETNWFWKLDWISFLLTTAVAIINGHDLKTHLKAELFFTEFTHLKWIDLTRWVSELPGKCCHRTRHASDSNVSSSSAFRFMAIWFGQLSNFSFRSSVSNHVQWWGKLKIDLSGWVCGYFKAAVSLNHLSVTNSLLYFVFFALLIACRLVTCNSFSGIT